MERILTNFFFYFAQNVFKNKTNTLLVKKYVKRIFKQKYSKKKEGQIAQKRITVLQDCKIKAKLTHTNKQSA